jgi:signal transduction histidine kinase
MKTNQNLSEAILTKLHIALVVLDPDYVLRHYTPAWLELVAHYKGIAREQIKPGVGFFELLPETAPALKPLFERVLAGETIRQEGFQLNIQKAITFWDLALAPVPAESSSLIAGSFSDVTARMVLQQRLDQQAELHHKELTTLLKVSNNLVSQNTEALLDLILEQLKTVVDYTGAAIINLDDDILTVIAYQGPAPPGQILGWQTSRPQNEFSQQVITRQEPAIISDIMADMGEARAARNIIGDWWESDYGYGRSCLGVPMMVKNQTTGILLLLHQEPDQYQARHGELVQAFGHYAAVALENDRLYQQARLVATLEERERLAQELHDNIAQALGYLNLKIGATRKLISNDKISDALENLRELKQLVGDTYTDVREEIFNLRGNASAGLSFMETLRQYVAKYQEHYRLEVEIIMETEEALLDFPAEVGLQIIRIIQEALINVRKHAHVKTAHIRFRRKDEEIRISVEDSGQGFDLDAMDRTGESGFGLEIMAERAESAGGRLELDAVPNGGVRVIIWIPMMRGNQF